MLGCIQPMSSPMMKRMFGCEGVAGCCALAGPAAHTDTNAVAPRSTTRDAAFKLARPDFNHDIPSGGAFISRRRSLLIASSFVDCFKRENSLPVILHADDDPAVLLGLVVQNTLRFNSK